MIHQFKEKFNEIILILFENVTGSMKRIAIAKLMKYFDWGGQTYISKILGVSRTTIRKAVLEHERGSLNIDRFYDRGRKPIISKLLSLENDIKIIVNSQSQTDPTFKSTRIYTRLTVKEIRNQLLTQGYENTELPSNETLRKITNSLGFTLKKIQKVKPIKKIEETDAIFENLHKVHTDATQNLNTVRISIDAKNRVKLGAFSRNGYSRILTQSLDHDFSDEYITPFGILDLNTDKVNLIFSESKVTADFIVDSIETFWLENYYTSDKNTLIINADNGPENNSRRSQFIKRITEFSLIYNVKVILAYYPPYHSKYNPVERVWGVLENHWNGSILDSKETCLRFAKTMTWKGSNPIISLNKKIYETGVKTSQKTLNTLEECLNRDSKIGKWFLTIHPKNVRGIVT